MQPRIYFTVLFYLKTGKQELFDQYENLVLPILPDYNGKLELRFRTNKASADQPDEIHVVSFSSHQDVENYKLDKIRKSYSRYAEQSIDEIVMIEGKLLS